MNFHGQEAISSPTRATGRTVLFFALLLGLAGLGWIDVADTSLLGLKVQPDKFIPMLQLICILSLIAHLVQWYGDHVSYQGWNVTGKLSGIGRIEGASRTKLDDLSDPALGPGSLEAESEWDSRKLDRWASRIEEMCWNMKSFDYFAKFYVYRWHLALPFAATVMAFSVIRYA